MFPSGYAMISTEKRQTLIDSNGREIFAIPRKRPEPEGRWIRNWEILEGIAKQSVKKSKRE